jgi:hypothetical protein
MEVAGTLQAESMPLTVSQLGFTSRVGLHVTPCASKRLNAQLAVDEANIVAFGVLETPRGQVDTMCLV